jgi:hypothetical protein
VLKAAKWRNTNYWGDFKRLCQTQGQRMCEKQEPEVVSSVLGSVTSRGHCRQSSEPHRTRTGDKGTGAGHTCQLPSAGRGDPVRPAGVRGHPWGEVTLP